MDYFIGDKRMKKISIIVPCYNEEENINDYYDATTRALAVYMSPTSQVKFDFVFVNDGSKDRTLQLIRELSHNHDNVKYISFSRNFGKEAAVFAGLEAVDKAGYDATIVMDADLQDDPNVIPKLVGLWENGYNHIYTKHTAREKEAFLKRVSAKAFYKIYSMLTGEKEMAQGARDFSLLDKKVIKAFLSFGGKNRFTKGISAYVGFKTTCVEFDYIPRNAGKTKWNYKKLFKYAFLGIDQFSKYLKIVPALSFLVFLGLLIADIVIYAINGWNFYTSSAFRTDLIGMVASTLIGVVVKLAYDVKGQTDGRKAYFVEESNMEDFDE